MTNRTFIREADLIRMARVAKREGVTVWVEIDGKKIGVTPEAQGERRQAFGDQQPEDFESLAEWQAWRDQERVRERLAALESKHDVQPKRQSPADSCTLTR